MFSALERSIYTCPVTTRMYDPLALRRTLLITGKGRFNQAVADYPKPEAEAVLVACGRAAFGLAPIDPSTGGGVGDAVVIEAVTAFTRWLKGKGPTAQSGPNSAPCTDCPPAAN